VNLSGAKVLRGGDHLYRGALQIVNTAAMPSWIMGEAEGWCVFLMSCLPLGVEPNLPGHHDLSSYTPYNREMLPRNTPPT